MEGFKNLFVKGDIKNLLSGFRNAIYNQDTVSTKIDGAPAIVMWRNIDELPGPGVSFKTIINQIKKDTAKNYFTSEDQIFDFMEKKQASSHRLNSFIHGLILTQYIKPGYLLWGDVLWSDLSELTDDGKFVWCKPNTIEYGINKKIYNIKNQQFGIVLHTAIKNGVEYPIKNLNEYIDVYSATDVCLITLDSLNPQIKNKKKLEKLLDKVEYSYSLEVSNILENPKFLKDFKKALKISSDLQELQKILAVDFDSEVVNNVIEFYSNCLKLNNEIANDYSVNGIISLIDDKEISGEGYVVNTKNGRMKIVSDYFTEKNKEHIHSLKESNLLNQLLREGLEQTSEGLKMKAWSSSKTPDLFKYYFDRNVEYGLGGGSNYGFATYLVTEPPFSEEAEVGYSDEYRKKLYGENVFEFTIRPDKLFYFQFDEYQKFKPNSDFNTFIKEQVDILQLPIKEEDLYKITPETPDSITSSEAINLFKLLSRSYYQGKQGNLLTPIDGFVYRGKNDGKVLVVWNSYALIPERLSHDCGKTWEDIDKSSPEYKEYFELSKKGSYNDNEEERLNDIFCGNKTPEKETVYRLLMKYNSNDGVDENGVDLRMSDGILFNIKIKDNKTIDTSFRYNLPYVDGNKHYFRLRKNQFIEQLADLGWTFGKITCDGIKIGGDNGKDWYIEDIPKYYYPHSCTGGLKIVNHTADKIKIDKILTDIEVPELILRNCEIDENTHKELSDFKVITESESKPCYCTSEEVFSQSNKWGWDIKEGTLLPTKPEKKTKKKKS